MEGIEDFFKGLFKILFIIFTIGLFIVSVVYYEKNKELTREVYELKVELKILKQYKK